MREIKRFQLLCPPLIFRIYQPCQKKKKKKKKFFLIFFKKAKKFRTFRINLINYFIIICFIDIISES